MGVKERYEERKKQSATGGVKERHDLQTKINFSTFNTDIEQFNKDYSADYLSNWHSAEDINTYYDRLSSLNDRTKAYQSYVNLYGTDEQKSVLGDIGKQISAYDEMIGKRQDVLDYYGTFKDAEAYSNALAYETEKAAKAKAEQERIASLDVDAVMAEIANIDNQVAQYENNKKKVYAVPNANINEVEAYARDMNNRIEALKEQKTALESDISAREIMDRNKMYTDILGSSEFASFVPTDDGMYDPVEMVNEPFEKTNPNVQFQYDSNGMITTNAQFANYGSTRYEHMTADEYKLYQYLKEFYGQEVAGQYAYDLDNELISRQQTEFKGYAEKHPVLGTIASFATAPMQAVDFVAGGLGYALTGDLKQGEMTAITSALREGASPDSDFGKFLYNTTTSGLDSFLAAALGGKAGGVILGLSAASSTMNDVLARGGTAEQALTSGVASGLFEGFFESFSIGRLKSMKPEEIVKNFKVFAQNALKSVATNASEELATEVANIIFDSSYMGELSNVSMMLDQYRSQGLTEEEAKRKVAHNLGVQVLEAAASGALIGGGMTAIGGGVGLAKVDKARREVGKSNISGGKTATLIKEATEYFKGEEYKKQQALIQKVEKGLADNKQGRSQQRNIGKLIEAYVEANYKEQNRELAEDSVNNIEKTKKTIENEATKTKVDNTNPTITNDNLPKILGFKEGKLSETVIETENGATAFTEESAANADIGTLYACAIRLGNTQSANNFVQNWDGITDPFQYYLDFLKFQMRGTYAPDSYDKTMTDYAGVKMSPAAKHAAFQSGISLRESTKEKITKQSEELKGEYEKLGGKAKKGKFNDSKLNYSALTKEQKDVVNFTRILSDYLGVNVEFFVSQKGKRGANGYYKAKNNTIYLDIYAGIGNKESYSAIKDCLINTMSHEIVHNMKVTAPTEYAALRDFIIDKLSKQEGYDLDAKIEQIIAENSDQGFTVEDAIEEIVAMSCEDLLGSSEKLQTTLTEFYAQNEKAANSFNKFVREVLNRLKAFFEKIIGKKSIAEESQLMAKQSAEFISELQKRYDAALLAMREGNAVRNTLGNLTATEQVTLAENGIAVDESTGDVHKVRNSVRYSTANKDAQGNIIDLVTVGKKSFNTEAIAKLVSTATGRSIEDARKWVRSEMAIANLVMDNPEFLDFEPDDRYQGIKKNSDYPQGTVDLSNLCPKREEFTTMFDLLQKKYPDKLFTAADVASMREILKNHGITVACGACFVEDRRQLLGEIADTYINMWKEAVENGTPLQKTNAEGKKIKLQITAALAKQYGLTKGADIMATDKYIPTQYDLTTYEGFKLLEKNHPLVAMGFNRYNNSRGQQAGRLIEGRAEYDRQILGWTPNKVKTVNNNGGLRIFSFSDFEVVHLLDLVQVIIDCAAMGVKIQGYTKIPAFARLVRNTGIKLNRSLIPKGETGIKIVNGKEVLDIDLVEGINIEDENFLDESDNDNVGNIIIGINPKQIGIAMLDDFIDYIIPFHTNKSKDICRKLGVGEWNNYKESQHEKDIDTGKASKHNVNIYTQVINKYHPTNKTEFVDAFLKECRSQKKVPRYSEFLYKEYKSDGAYSDEGGRFDYTYREGYHKLLVDFKMFDKAGNILPQGDIVPELDDAFMAELLDKEISRKMDYTFPQEVYDEIDRVFGDGDKVMRQARENKDTFVEDKYFKSQMKKWDTLPYGSSVKVGKITDEHPLVKVGMPQGIVKYDVSKLDKNMDKHKYLKPKLLKEIPNIIADPIAISEYTKENNTVSVFGDVFVGSSPMMVGVTIAKDISGVNISKVRTYNARSDAGNLITDKTVLYLNENKKRTRKWFQICGIQVPLEETKFGFIRSISQPEAFVNPSDEKTFEQKRIETPGASEVLSDLFRDNPNLNGYAEQKQELKSYKELLRSVRVNEQRIAEIDAEIKSLKRKHAQSGKGTRMAELYEMRKRAEDRVKEKQNRMFKMEATSLKEVIQKETARLLTERSKEERDLSKKQQKEIRENYARREYIKKIEDRAKGLTNAVKNVGDKHVPAPLREAIADLVMSLDFSSKSKLAGKGDTKKDIQFADAFRQLANLVGNKLPNTTDKETAPLDEFFIDCDITDEFRNQFEEIKNEIDNIVYRRGGSGEDTYVLRNLSSEQLRQINSALYKLGKQISKANQLMENNLYKNVIEMSEDFLTFADKFVLKQDVKWLEKLIDVDNLIPYYAFKRMGKVGMSLFNEWADGMDKYAKVAKEVVDFTNSLYTAKEIKEWNNTVHEIEIKGKKLYFTTAHLMSFYCLWKREAAKSHISGYGIRVETFDVDKTAKKPLGKTYTNPANGVHITDETAQILLDELNKDKRAKVVADALQKYMSTRCAELANEITMKRFGEKAYTEEFYFPMEVNENEKPEAGEINAESLYALVNKYFTKQLTPNSTSSLTIRNIFDVFASHTTDVAAYHSLAIPLLDTLKFYNYKQKGYDAKGDSEAKTVRGKIVEAFGEPFLNYLKNFIKDTTGTSITSDRGSDAVGKWVSRYKIAAVAANLRVIVLQPTSYLRVSAVMKHRYLVKEIKDIPQLNKAVERMNKYSGVALWKNELGFRDVNISRSLADKIKHADTIGDKVTDIAMKGAELADKITWANIWLACEEEIKATEKNIPVGSDAFYDKVSKRFRDVIYSTQVVDSPLAKSNMARSKSFWNRTVTSFMSEPVVSHNLMLDAYHELADAKRRGEKVTWNNVRRVGRLVLAYTINATAQAVVSSLIDAARKIADDEDEEFADAYWGEFISNFLQELNPLSKIPIIKDIIDVIRATFSNGYYSGQSMETAVFDRVAKAIKESIKFYSGESSTTKLVKRIMDAISSLTGIPIGNTYREIKTIWNNLTNLFK